jgi:FkbM family methyltransferase
MKDKARSIIKRKLVHIVFRTIVFWRLEPLFVFLSKQFPLFLKLVPLHTFYPAGTTRQTIRNEVLFDLDISDYMQWYLFIDGEDHSWKFASENILQNSLILDIGSNIGHFSLKLAMALSQRGVKNVEIHSFEPNPLVFELLKRNLSLNQTWCNQVKTHQLAVGSANSVVEFIFSMRNSGAGRMMAGTKGTTRVNVTRIDSFLQNIECKRKVSFIKIDVEGFEPEVFEGAWPVIEKHRPVIYFEYSPFLYNHRGIDAFGIIEKLESFNYSMVYEDRGQLIDVRKDIERFKSVYQTNVLATPQATSNQSR